MTLVWVAGWVKWEHVRREWSPRETERERTAHDVWVPLDTSVEVAATRPSAWCRKQSPTYREGCSLEFILDTNLNRLPHSSVLLQADNKGLYFVLKRVLLLYLSYINWL